MANAYSEQLHVRDQSSGDESSYNVIINKMIDSGPHPLLQKLSDPSLQNLLDSSLQNWSDPLLQKLSDPLPQNWSDPLLQNFSDPSLQNLSDPLLQNLSDPLPQPSSEDLQKIQAPPAAETLPVEDEARWSSTLEILEEGGLNWMLDRDELTKLISKRPKKGKMYSALASNVNTILKEIPTREEYDKLVLENLVDMGREIADAVSVLKILGKSTDEIELMGEVAQMSALWLHAAFTLQNQGAVLLWEIISKLRSMNFDP